MNFHENLLRLRTEKKLTQKAIAKEVGISWRAYQNYERGTQEPTLSVLVALADFYDISLDELVCRQR